MNRRSKLELGKRKRKTKREEIKRIHIKGGKKVKRKIEKREKKKGGKREKKEKKEKKFEKK